VILATALLEDLRDGGAAKSRALLRLVPIQAVTKAADFAKTAEDVVQRVFKTTPSLDQQEQQERQEQQEQKPPLPKSFCVVFKSRLSDGLSRDEAIAVIGRAVREVSPSTQVDYKNPSVTIIVSCPFSDFK